MQQDPRSHFDGVAVVRVIPLYPLHSWQGGHLARTIHKPHSGLSAFSPIQPLTGQLSIMANKSNQVFLIWGGNGWIAGILYDMLRQQGRNVHSTTIRMENREEVMAELKRVKPTHVLNCAGVTGRPNVDWCEDNKPATIRANLIGTNNLADCCFLQGIHCTIYATGCK